MNDAPKPPRAPAYAPEWPLSTIDDHMIHQTPDPIRIMWTSDVQAYERSWTVCHTDDGRGLVALGVSFYPNLDAAEAWAIVNIDGIHASVRALRRIGHDRMDMHVGPIRPTIVEGLRHWHLELAENEWGARFSLDFRDTTRAVQREPHLATSPITPGRQPQVTAGFEGFGSVTGWASIGDKRVEFVEGQASGTRDRHWGTGRGVGGPDFSFGRRPAGGMSGNLFVMLPDLGIWGDRVFYRHDDPRPGAGEVVNVERRVRFEESTRMFVEAEVDVTLSDGTVRHLHMERIGNQIACLRTGFYGGTPDTERYAGQYPMGDIVEGSVDDLNEEYHRIRLAGLDEHVCRVTCDGEQVTGIFQPVDPDAYEACVKGRPGWSFL